MSTKPANGKDSDETRHTLRIGKARSDVVAWTKRALIEERRFGRAKSYTLEELEKARTILLSLRKGREW